MLSRKQRIIVFDQNTYRAIPDMLVLKRHGNHLAPTEVALEIYRQGAGRQRQELHRAVHAAFEHLDNCTERRVNAFCKLLDERATYDTSAKKAAPRLRKRLWTEAATHHPLVSDPDSLLVQREAAVKARIAAGAGLSWDALTRDLWADVTECERLLEFEGYTSAQALLSRYNVAQYQAALFDATDLTIQVRLDLKTIIRATKLAGLVHDITPLSDGVYQIILSGAASPLRDTKRYGPDMAKFLPTLLSCQGWQLRARLMRKHPTFRWTLEISPKTGLKVERAELPDFDSEVERGFWAQWRKNPVAGWSLQHEKHLLWKGQTVFIPDFTLIHDSGRAIHLEIVGFWTPEYLEEKIRKLTVMNERDLLLIVQDDVWRPEFGSQAVRYKSVIRIAEVMQAAETLIAGDKLL
jgi:predicted nuclease of restriction endonuclease-like RecB superfamily